MPHMSPGISACSSTEGAVRGVQGRAQPGRQISPVSASPSPAWPDRVTANPAGAQATLAEAEKGSCVLTALWEISLHSFMRGHHPQPRLDTAWGQSLDMCSLRAQQYEQVLSRGTPLVLVAIPTVIHSAWKTARRAPILQLYSTAKSQHQTPQQQSLSSGTMLESWTQLGDSAKCCCSDIAIHGLMKSFPPGTDSTRMGLVFALWCCEWGYDQQASVFTGKHPLTPQHKLIASVRWWKHLEINRSPPLLLLEVAVHEQHDHMNSFSRLLLAQEDKKQDHSSQFTGQRSSLSMQKSKGRAFPGAIFLTPAGVPVWPALHLLSYSTILWNLLDPTEAAAA